MKPSHFRWYVILLLFAINIVNYIDRSAIAFAAHQIQREFALSDGQVGLILGAFGIGYACSTFLGGFVADRYGGRITFIMAVMLWSLSTGWAGLATGFAMLYAARMALGLAEGPSFPAHARIVERWLPHHERATAMAAALAAIPLALALGAPTVAYLIDAMGWRVMFFVLAVSGLMWLPFWYLFARDAPRDSPHVNKAEHTLIVRGRDGGAEPTHGEALHKTDWKLLVTTPTLLAGYWSYFVFGYLLFFIMTWLPEFLRTTYALDLTQVGWVSAIPWAAALAALYIVGRLSDRLVRDTGKLRLARSYLLAGCNLIAAAALTPIAIADSLPLALACLSVAVAAAFGANPLYYAVITDVAPRSAGTCMGIMNSGFAASGFLAPVITGYTLQATGSFASAFWLIALLILSSVVVVLLFHRPDRDVARIRAAE